jgi:Glucose-6-phosphate dehydrogenase subunit
MTLTTKAVSPGEIQDALNKIWESLETTNVTRASLFNLVFYCEKNNRTPYVQKVAQKIIEKFPSRVIFIAVDKESKDDSLKTEVSILTSSRGEFDVACDYIQIEAAGAWQSRVPFVMLPHILPDLPVYLIWAEDPCDGDPLFQELNTFTSRLICDSETTDNLPRFCTHMIEHYEAAHTDIADLNWARIESWRELLSMVFYSEENLDRIRHAKRIVLNYNAKESAFFCHTRIQAIYLQAWIACQLNWEYQGTDVTNEKDMHFFYKSKFSPIEVVLSPTMNPKLPAGLILTLDIATLDEHTFSFSRDLEQIHRITLHSFEANQCDIPVTYILQKAESGHSLVKEVTHRGTSKHFLKVLHLLKSIDQGIC